MQSKRRVEFLTYAALRGEQDNRGEEAPLETQPRALRCGSLLLPCDKDFWARGAGS